MKWKTVVMWSAAVIGVIFIGGASGILMERAVLPWLSVQRGLDRVGFLKRSADRVTVVNKVEQITIREDDSLVSIVSQPSTAVVTLIPTHSLLSERDATSNTLATGVLLTNDGLIVVYRDLRDGQALDTSSRLALLFDGSSHEARFVGADTLTNLVFFRIEAQNVPFIALANSNDTAAGKKVLALKQSAQAYQDQLTPGTVEMIDHNFNLSGKTVASSEKWEGVFHANFSQASRFVGSPVIQYNGEMIGILGSLSIDNVTQTFILPARAIQQSIDDVLAETSVKRPLFGAYYLSITPALALEYRLSQTGGALIYAATGRTGLALISGKAADKAGLQANDIVTAINGKEITLENPLSVAISAFKSGDTLTVTIDRGGVVSDLLVTL